MDNLENLARPVNTQLAVRDAHEAFARLTRLARRALNAPEALISLLEADTEPAAGDGSVRNAPLAYGLCHCVVESGEPLVIVETRARGEPDDVVAFAGMPLREPSGRTVGTLAVLDHRPRRWTDAELRFLGELGRAAETEIALRGAPSQLSSPPSGRSQPDALRTAEERFRMAFEHAPIGMALLHPAGHYLKVNRAFCTLVGYPEEELLRLTFQDVTHPDDLAPDLELHERLLTGEIDDYRVEKRYVRQDGQAVWAKLSVSAVRDADGRPLHLISHAEDIHAEHQAREALRASEPRYASIAANLPGMVYRFTRSPTGEIGMPFASEGAREIFGREAAELMADPQLALDAVHPDDREAYQRSVENSARARGRWEWHGRMVQPDGTVKYVHGTSMPTLDADGNCVWDGVLVDETHVHEAQVREARARERFEVALIRAPIGMAITDLEGRFLRINDALCEMAGRTASELEGTDARSLIHPDDRHRADEILALLGQDTDAVAYETRIMHAAGKPVWAHARATLIRDESGEPLHVLAQVQDISERRRYEERLRHMVDHDPLTGLLNRRGFEVALNAHLAHVRRYGAAGALLVLDLDGFKFINDSLGHAVGDQLVITCARALSSRLRESDVVARLGGDEFAILLPSGTEDEAKTVAQAAIETIRQRSGGLSGADVGRVTASVGIAPFRAGALTADEMLVNADLAMYDAKEAGKNRFSVFGAGGHPIPRIKAHMSWLERIRRALSEDRYCLYAQPVVELASGHTIGHEVLVRMVGEDGELVTPGRFLYIAERFGVIGEVDRWIVSHAIRAMGEARTHGRRLALAVNICGASAGEEAMLATITDELGAAEVDPSDLTLEITETAAVADIPRARRFAEALASIGCRVALDDFGAGFGSFYYLKYLPFDALKIDGEFVRHACENPTDRLVIKAVSDIARGLGKQTIAEFVPDEQTLQLLGELGVDCAQGFFLGRPRPLDELLAQPAFSR